MSKRPTQLERVIANLEAEAEQKRLQFEAEHAARLAAIASVRQQINAKGIKRAKKGAASKPNGSAVEGEGDRRLPAGDR